MSFICLLFVIGPFILLFLPSCRAFTPACTNSITGCPLPSRSHHPQRQHSHHRRISPLQAVTKRQTLILDGAELSYYVKSLARSNNDHSHLPNVAPRSPQKRNRIGAITLVTCSVDKDVDWNGTLWIEKGAQIIGVEVSSSSLDNTTDDSREIISIDQDLHLYKDSIAILPSRLSPADAISTAATSLLAVHCSSLNSLKQKKKGKVVIVGGGEYAIFLAKALVGLGSKVSLVTARPAWSLPSPTDIASSKNKHLIEILPPAVGTMALGFATAIGEFDTLIDTLGDELGMGRARTVLDNDIMDGGRFLEQLKELNGCDNYLSTLTRSQQYVLKQGLLFARDPVIRYQKEVEKLTSKYQILPPPFSFGSTLQLLLDQNIIYSSDQNENGSHKTKSNFVRGWSLSDLTELKTWPSEGPRRFGFPVVDVSVSSLSSRRKAMAASLNTNDKSSAEIITVGEVSGKQSSDPEDTVDEEQEEEEYSNTDIMVTTPKSNANNTIKITKRSSKSAASSNPYVTTIQSASELNQQIIERKRNCILFLTASYCQKCKQMTPQLNRIARMSSEENSDVLFAHVDISSGPRGKQLGKILGVDKVPSVIVFQKGDHLKIGDETSTVVERSNLNMLEKVAKVLESGERNVNVEALLSSETVKK